MMRLLFVLAVLSHAEARISTPTKAGLVDIDPPLKDVSSDKKFFGPPFPADYPEDKRPAIDKSVLRKLKSPDQPYPALQSKADFDSDFVKDENSDTGAWQAQFEYDELRKQLAAKQGDEKRAEARAARERSDVDGAQRNSDGADKAVNDAQKDVDAAAGDEKNAKKAEDFGGAPSAEKLEELKKAVAEAEAAYEKQKKAFAVCEQQLKDAKAELDDLKAKQAAMEKELASATKLYLEKKEEKAKARAVQFNIRKSKDTAEAKELASKITAATGRMLAAQKVKADMDKALAKQKSEHDQALKNVQKEKAELEQTKKELEKAASKLQVLHGYKPKQAEVPKPAASAVSSMWGWVTR